MIKAIAQGWGENATYLKVGNYDHFGQMIKSIEECKKSGEITHYCGYGEDNSLLFEMEVNNSLTIYHTKE